jgi:glycine cleavage system H lipoate-binding protein
MDQENKTPRIGQIPQIHDLTSGLCVWARASLAPARACHNAFDCISCAFDKKVQRDLAQAKLRDHRGEPLTSWNQVQRRQTAPAQERLCRHAITGRTPGKVCPNNFECASCAFDQMLDDQPLARPAARPSTRAVAGFTLAENHYFHQGHAWARLEYGGRVRVGLDDFAARLFGPLDRLVLPELGQEVKRDAGETGLERGGQAAGLPCPLSGVVAAVNPALARNPRAAHDDPYGQGWLFLLEPARLQGDLRKLAFGAQAVNWLEEDAARLAGLVTGEPEMRLAATGGRAVDDIYGSVPGLDWTTLAKEFLHTA